MIVDGDRLRYLFKRAKHRVVICAPFIKKNTLLSLLDAIDESVQVDVFTRWHLHELALGVSDLEVFDLLDTRKNSNLYLIQNLHAKLYSSDGEFLVGSANVTNSALGWSSSPNLEILVPVAATDHGLKSVLTAMKVAEEVTPERKSELEDALGEMPPIEQSYLEKTGESIPDQERSQEFWIPRCSMPRILWHLYQGEDLSKRYTLGTIEDGRDDLAHLYPPDGLEAWDFCDLIASRLRLSPIFSSFIEQIPRRLSEEKAFQILGDFFPDMKDDEKKIQWDILTQWIVSFFSEYYEVAPTKFEVRLK